MPKKKPLEISKEFVEQVLAIIANESEEGRKKIVAIAKRAAEQYEQPVKSWLTGWFYQYTRTRGDKIEQSINVMSHFPDAYTRLQEFKLIISSGEWKVGSYNYLLFLELIDAVPDYGEIDEPFVHSFIVDLKDLVIKQIDSFMFQYKSTMETMKARALERETMRQNERQGIKNILVFNDLKTAKESASQQQDATVFTLSFKHDVWQLFWIDRNGDSYLLSPSSELVLKLAISEQRDVEKLNEVSLKQIKKECLKARDLFLSKIKVTINPSDDNTHCPLSIEKLIANGVTASFVLHHTEKETTLCWINSIGVANPIDLGAYPKLNSWLTTHKAPFNEADKLQLKTDLLSIKTTQPFSSSKLERMNKMLDKVLKKQSPQEKPLKDEHIGKLDLELFGQVKHHLEQRVKKVTGQEEPVFAQSAVTVNEPNKLNPERYKVLAQLPMFWQKQRDKDVASNQDVVQNPRNSL